MKSARTCSTGSRSKAKRLDRTLGKEAEAMLKCMMQVEKKTAAEIIRRALCDRFRKQWPFKP